MYRNKVKNQLVFEDFYLPFGGHLNGTNRWIQLAKLVPWDEFEEQYAELFAQSGQGAPAKPFRMALGALLIKEKLNITDEETVSQIRENPYLQFLLGMESFRDEEPFEASMMVHFRKRITGEMLSDINERIHQELVKKKQKDTPTEGEAEVTRGKLLVDATCTPADIRYPTDLSLLNEAREKTERIITLLHQPLLGKEKKPRTYRQIARKDYLAVTKKRKPGKKAIRKGIRKQLQYIQRNLNLIQELSQKTPVSNLSNKNYRDLLVIQELYRQQNQMYKNKINSVADRIVSIHQPQVRPIVRGKASAATEFGAKLTISVVDGFVFQEKVSWDPYNEAKDLIDQIEKYKGRFGCYPESVHVDKIYRNRENRQYCSERGIRLSGPPLGRPPKDQIMNREKARQVRADERDRIPVEGKFGNGKRRYGLNRIMAKRADTSETVIGVTILVMNLEKILRDLFALFFSSVKTTHISFFIPRDPVVNNAA